MLYRNVLLKAHMHQHEDQLDVNLEISAISFKEMVDTLSSSNRLHMLTLFLDEATFALLSLP